MAEQREVIDYRALFSTIPTPYLVMTPDLVILDANDAYLANVARTRAELVGRPVFEAFPPADDALDEHGVPRVRVSLERARETRRPDVMPLQKYDIPEAATGRTVERYWSLISVPVLADDGTVALVCQRAEDITDVVRDREAGRTDRGDGEVWRRRVEEVETDLLARAQEVTAAVQAQELASRRLASLAEVALELASAETVQELARTVFADGLPVLGAAGGALAVRTPGSDELVVTVTGALDPEVREHYARLPVDGPLPMSLAARGQLVIVEDLVAALEHEGLPEALADFGLQALVAVPLQSGPHVLGALVICWTEPRTLPPQEVELVRAFAAQCAQVLDRLQTREAEREAAQAVQRVSETLQRSLLTPPPDVPGLAVAVRYLPASQVAQVGGDWYDAYVVPGGPLSLVIGDVAGHDEDAAAAMAQVRNVLRGVAQTLGSPPAAVLAGLDRALAGLDLGLLATVVVAQVDQGGTGRPRTLSWCNAGHPPPVLASCDGTVRLLTGEPDLLVGLTTRLERADHEVELRPGDTVLLYTDGLVETRGGDIETDLQALVELVRSGWSPDEGPQELVDRLVDGLTVLNDDVALLAVQVR